MAVTNFLGVFGHVVVDHILRVQALPCRHTTVRVLERSRHFGGTGGNIARIASHLGVRTALASFVGEDFPEDYRETLADEGVDLTDLRTVPGTTTPMAWIFNDPKGEQATVIDQGPMWQAHRRKVPEHTVRSARVVHLGTGRAEYHARVARLASSLRKTIAFDPSQEIAYAYDRASFMAILRHAHLLFGNETEIARALRYARLRKPEDLLAHVDTVVVTRGKRGSLVASREEGTHRIPAIRPKRVADATGAGDAYRAGFYAALSRGYDVRRCGLMGSAVASFAVEAVGTQTRMPRWEEALARAEREEPF